jgi:3-oxoacid CoA-transferase subunit B
MTHRDRKGNSKLLRRCTLPLTAVGCIDLVITDLGAIAVEPSGFRLLETAPGVTAEEVVAATEAPLAT